MGTFPECCLAEGPNPIHVSASVAKDALIVKDNVCVLDVKFLSSHSKGCGTILNRNQKVT